MNRLFKAFKDANHELLIVGGYVRDRLRGVASDDIDFATSALPDETIEVLKYNNFKAIPIGIDFGTIQTDIDGAKVEITTFRSEESYTKGSRHPTVKWGKTIKEDLARRDFTFNAIAMREDGSLIDPFGGKANLRDGVIDTPQDPNVIFSDDPLRMLRAARFVARDLGKVSDRVFLAMINNAPSMSTLSGERVFEEVSKILMSPQAAKGIRLLEDTGVWSHFFTLANERAKVIQTCRSLEAKWSLVFHDYHNLTWVRDRRVSMSNDFFKKVAQLVGNRNNLYIGMSEIEMRRLIAEMGDNIDFLKEIHVASSLCLMSKIDYLKGGVSSKLPTSTGNLLMVNLGVTGMRLGQLMKDLRQELIDGKLTLNSDFVEAGKRILDERP